MKATELKSILFDLSSILLASGSKQAAQDVHALSRRIDAQDQTLAFDAIKRLGDELLDASTPECFTPEKYIECLTTAGRDAKAFDDVFRKFKQDKTISKADAITVLKGYAGEHVRVRTKAEALEEIQREFSRLLYDANTARQATTTPW